MQFHRFIELIFLLRFLAGRNFATRNLERVNFPLLAPLISHIERNHNKLSTKADGTAP